MTCRRSVRRTYVRWTRRLLATLISSCLVASAGQANIGDGDLAWTTRAEVLEAERAEPARIEQAIGHYRDAVEADPASLEARWKLLRALHYAIDFTTLPDKAKDARVDEAVKMVRASGDLMDEADPATRDDRARLLFWSSIAWGTRAQRVGLLTIVREGAAKRMYDDAQRSLQLDPSVDRGGALRLLSRLHATLPRVPFVSGWVDRDQALPLAERGYALDPDHPGNRLILALTLLERAQERTEQARELLESVASSEPRTDYLVEDLRIREQARERLSELESASS